MKDGESTDLIPVRIMGATDILNEKLVFVFEYENGEHKLLRSSVANIKFPQLVIAYYEANYVWKE